MDFTVRGIIVPIITPFDENDRLDVSAINLLVEFLISRGVHGLFPGGTTGEGPLLSLVERCQLAESVVDAVGTRIPVIVHTGAMTTKDTLTLTQHAKKIGAQAAAIIPPYFYHYSDRALFKHFDFVASCVPDFPLYLYNNPSVSGNNLSIELINELRNKCPNIIGMKDSSGNLDTLLSISMDQSSFNTISGSDENILSSIALGLDACVSGNANVIPELIVALYNAADGGDLELARELQQQLNEVRWLLGDGKDLSIFKGILKYRGLSVGSVRRPLLQTPENVIEKHWQDLRRLLIDKSQIEL